MMVINITITDKVNFSILETFLSDYVTLKECNSHVLHSQVT